MPMKRIRGVTARRTDDQLMLRDEPPLGSLQAKILKKLDLLKAEAFGYRVLVELLRERELAREGRYYIDPAQVYSSMRKMVEKGYIEQVGTKIEKRGPPQKIYRLTESGRAALKITKAYHQALGEYL